MRGKRYTLTTKRREGECSLTVFWQRLFIDSCITKDKSGIRVLVKAFEVVLLIDDSKLIETTGRWVL
ncbi:hypothetical protein BUALT_Bualt18G0025100 [Buddleja alternifolia]|uniref:Uncharacterized protein n=1 Tax=Buddleja alternifolia TaxID=168488 RepID=A0AAV6W343_9LAMI|nr:hypothetical protein BUALT_Bualt18G0025100 [Buddleja alternifolia]